MTDAMTSPVTVLPPAFQLTPLGSPDAAACEGDVCVIPDHHEQAVVNRRIDDGAI